MFNRKPKIKICGITSLEDALDCIKLKIDFLGFIFYKKSPRYISPCSASGIIADCKRKSARCKIAGVFVNEKRKTIMDVAGKCRLDILQFSGKEQPGFCAVFPKHEVWKTIHIKSELSLASIGQYGFLSGIHLDNFHKGKFGGTGKSFDFNLARKAKKIVRRIILSGGLNKKNVKEAVNIAVPWAVDIGSGGEACPGKKDMKKIKEIIRIIKE